MNCRYCLARGINRKLPRSLSKRIHHFTANHPDVVAGMSMRIAANPRQFGEALGVFVRQALTKNGGAVRLMKMLDRDGGGR